jgi:PST family polysaccharide transporter
MLADYSSRNVDNLIVGGVLGATALGFYAMAYQAIRVPDMLISGPLYLYIFTAMSRAAHAGDIDAIRDLAKAALRLGSAVLAPLFCGLAVAADLAVGVVLGPKWLGAIGALRWLAGAGFAFAICSLTGAMLTGLGRADLRLRLSMTLGVVTIATVAAAARFGVTPVAAALACGVAVVCGLYLTQLARHLKTPRLGLLLAMAPAGLGSLALAAGVFTARWLLRSQPPAVELAGAVLAGAACYAAVVWATARRSLLSDARAFSRAQA